MSSETPVAVESPDNVALRELRDTVKELRVSVHKFGVSSDNSAKKMLWLTGALIFLTVILIWATFLLISDAKEQTLSQNRISLENELFSPSNTKIIDAIESNAPILKENSGKYSEAQLDNYVGDFDTIESVYDKNLLSEDDFCKEFSYYVQITQANKEVESYIASQQKAIGPDVFVGLEDMFEVMNSSKNPDCK